MRTNCIIEGDEFHKCLIRENFTLLFNRCSKQSGKFSLLNVWNGSICEDFLPQKAIRYTVYISVHTFGLCVCVCVCVYVCVCVHARVSAFIRLCTYICTQINLRSWSMSRYIAGLVHSINIAVWAFSQCTLKNSIGGYFTFGDLHSRYYMSA